MHIILKEYLYNADIYKGKRNMSKHDLIEMIIIGKTKKMIYAEEDDNLLKEKAHELIKYNKSQNQNYKLYIHKFT